MVVGLTVGCDGVDCDKSESTDNQSVCTTTWSDCSDDSDYKTTCTIRGSLEGGGMNCVCEKDGVTTAEDVFLLNDQLCAGEKEASAGCGWELVD